MNSKLAAGSSLVQRFAALVAACWLLGAAALPSAAGSWPNDRGRADRAGVAEESLRAPLSLAWTHRARQAPRPAFRGAARYPDRQPDPITYDHAYRLVADGGSVFYGSSADDSLVCLDAKTGQVQWRFFTAGPVRLAPTLCNGKLYAGSDDGNVYCLDASSGREVWRFRAAPGNRLCIGNGRVISAWPVRRLPFRPMASPLRWSQSAPTKRPSTCAT